MGNKKKNSGASFVNPNYCQSRRGEKHKEIEQSGEKNQYQ